MQPGLLNQSPLLFRGRDEAGEQGVRGERTALQLGVGLGSDPERMTRQLHDLHTERFFKPVMVNNMMEIGDGPIKTFAFRGVKDNPPYLHDERLLTLDDTVEFFNLVLGDKLTEYDSPQRIHCQGYEGDPKGKARVGPCLRYFKVKAWVKYKSAPVA